MFEVSASRALFDLHDLFGSTFGNHAATARAAFWTHIDDVVGRLDDVEVVLDDDHAVTGVDERLEYVQELLDVGTVQPCRRLIKDIERLTGREKVPSRA